MQFIRNPVIKRSPCYDLSITKNKIENSTLHYQLPVLLLNFLDHGRIESSHLIESCNLHIQDRVWSYNDDLRFED
ncbi:unnamed protein product [Rhizophagus irregularis]|nr:unnamed protein product [Rhizophagus irregularis]